MSQFIPHYEVIWNKLDELRKQHPKKSSERNFINAVGLLNYFVFDTLFSAYQAIRTFPEHEKRTMSPCFELPFFMGTYLNLISINEYLVSILVLVCEQEKKLDRAFYDKLSTKNGVPRRDDRKARSEMLTKLHADFQEFDPSSLYLGKQHSGKHEELRHWLVHRFRPLWWHRENYKTKGFGFPKRMFQPDGIADEVWEAIQDADGWNDKTHSLQESEFISAQDVLLEVHRDKAKLADAIWNIAIQKVC